MFPVNEIFETVQGEGRHAGRPSTFVRFQGCDVGCPWCDTKHTWAVDDKKIIPFAQMLKKTASTDQFAYGDAAAILAAVSALRPKRVVLTGGEPCQYDLRDLTEALCAVAEVQVETSGTEPIRVDDRVFVTLSPKLNMNRPFLFETLARADELKFPLGKRSDMEKLLPLLDQVDDEFRAHQVSLQPLSMNRKATRAAIDLAIERGYNVSIQTHKVAGVR